MLLTLSLLTVLNVAAADSIPGVWQVKGDVQGNPIDEVCTVKQVGSVLSGSCIMGGSAKVDLTGEMKDGKITFQHGGDYEGQALTIIYSGTLASPKEIKGTVLVQPFGVDGVFTATPKAEPAG